MVSLPEFLTVIAAIFVLPQLAAWSIFSLSQRVGNRRLGMVGAVLAPFVAAATFTWLMFTLIPNPQTALHPHCGFAPMLLALQVFVGATFHLLSSVVVNLLASRGED